MNRGFCRKQETGDGQRATGKSDFRHCPSPVACFLLPVSPDDLALLKLVYGRPKDIVDLERLFAARGDLIVPPADARLATLADLAKRLGNR